MAEPRRVQLTTLSRTAPASFHPPASGCRPPPGEAQEGTGRSDARSVRLQLKLFESDERDFPEFNYCQLIEDQLNQREYEGPLSVLENEKREKEEIAAIARQLEEKYGKSKKKDRIQDLIDIGYGYDDEDSFIDNSEAYDEFVPASITTKLGGFYVNSGVLQYRQASDAEIEEFTTAEEMPEMSKKHKLPGRRDKMKRCSGEERKNISPHTSPPSDIDMKSKKKKALKTLSVTSMLRRFQREKDTEQRTTIKGDSGPGQTVAFPCPADAAGGGGGGLELADPLLSLIGSTNDQALIQAASTVDFDIDLESLLDVSEEATSSKAFPQLAAETLQIQTKAADPSHAVGLADAVVENPKTNSQPKRFSERTRLPPEDGSASLHQCPQLPEGLSSGLEESIRKLIAAAKTAEGESKVKFFSPDINSILLDIELQCREQGGPLRSKVYTHLSSFMPCSRDTLLKRVKKLVNTHTEPPLNEEDPMKKLKEAIGRAMPEQITCFQESCQAYEQIKSRATDEDNVEEKGGKRGGPRKLFKFNAEIRECLSHVLKDKMSKYEKEKKEGQEMECIKTLLDTEVKPLWPKGWMQSRMLVRESKKMLGLSSSLPMKKAKNEKRQCVTTPSNSWDGLPPAPVMTKDLSREADNGLDTPPSVLLSVAQKEAPALNKVQPKKGSDPDTDTPAEADKPRAKATSAPTLSHLLPPKEEPVIQQQQQLQPQELFTAAVAPFSCSDQDRSFGVNAKSPPQPRSHPLGISVIKAAPPPQVKEPAAQVYIISDDDDVKLQ